MFIFDISNPLTLLLMLAVTVLLIFLSQEIKQSYLGAIMLFVYLIILIIHVAQIATLSEEYRYLLTTLSRCVVIDFIFVFLTFFSYLWVDDMEAKVKGKKSIDNSLDWFWKKV
jgi:amino acid transporter